MLYEIPVKSNKYDSLPKADGLQALTSNLGPLESVTVWGESDHAKVVYSKVGYRAKPATQIPYRHRFVDDGSAVFAVAPLGLPTGYYRMTIGGCNYQSYQYEGLGLSVILRKRGDFQGVFGWTIGNSGDGTDCARRLLDNDHVDGLIAGSRAADYASNTDTHTVAKTIIRLGQ